MSLLTVKLQVTGNFELAFLIEGLQVEVVTNGPRIHGMYYDHDQWLKIFKQSKLVLG